MVSLIIKPLLAAYKTPPPLSRISYTDRHRILNIPNASLDFRLSCPAGPTEILCTNAIKCLRSKLHGRQRTDMRLAHKEYMSFLESQREQGKLRSVIKAILGANAGRICRLRFG